MASADADGLVDVGQDVLVHRTGYTRRHVYTLRQDLVCLGLWDEIRSSVKKATYKMADGNPSAQPVPVRYTLDDVFELQKDHAQEFGYPEPSQVAGGKLADRVLEALEMFGPDVCRAAHVGHHLHTRAWEQGVRFASFTYCYPKEGDGSGRLAAQWFEEMAQQGGKELRKRAARAAADAAARRKQKEERCKTVTPEQRKRGKAMARRIIDQLRGRSSSGLAFSEVVPGVSTLGAAPTVAAGRSEPSGAATAAPSSSTCSTEEES